MAVTPMIRGVVFDFDGTLVESNQIKRQTFFELANDFEGGVRLMAEVMQVADGHEREWIFARFAAGLPGRADATMLVERYTRLCEERIAQAPEVPGARSTLDALRERGMLLFVNSATPVHPLTRLVQQRKLDGLFTGIYGAPAKKAENLESIRSRYQFDPAEIMVVGDGESDRACAEMFGCHFVAVENTDNDFKKEPACRMPDLGRLPAIVSAINMNANSTTSKTSQNAVHATSFGFHGDNE